MAIPCAGCEYSNYRKPPHNGKLMGSEWEWVCGDMPEWDYIKNYVYNLDSCSHTYSQRNRIADMLREYLDELKVLRKRRWLSGAV